jgi:hypothetical protein
MSAPIALVVCIAIFALVVLVALFRMCFVRAKGSFCRASFEFEARSPRSNHANERREKVIV